MNGQNKRVLSEIDFGGFAQVKLEKKLREVSGLASTGDGRIFTHNVEFLL